MIRYRGDLAIITDKNPVLLDGYKVDGKDIRVQRRIIKPCEFRAETYTPSACCGRMTKVMKMTYTCLALDKTTTSKECGECHEQQ